MNREESRALAKELAKRVDVALKKPRDPRDPPTDGMVAVMTIFEELEKMGYTSVRKRF